MKVLLDTNILARAAEPAHVSHSLANTAIRAIHVRGDEPVVVPQVIYEFWVIATRPLDQNGLGFDVAAAGAELVKIEALFAVLEDTPAILPKWKQLVTQHQVMGKLAHDARLVAAMLVHGLTDMITFNKGDFGRFGGITVRSPQEVIV
jgi:predicted nucleic acid-binding protein